MDGDSISSLTPSYDLNFKLFGVANVRSKDYLNT